MTDEPTEEQTTEAQADEAVSTEPRKTACVHCGKKSDELQAPGSDWQCKKCERYQDSSICPTCHQIARTSLMEGGN